MPKRISAQQFCKLRHVRLKGPLRGSRAAMLQ